VVCAWQHSQPFHLKWACGGWLVHGSKQFKIPSNPSGQRRAIIFALSFAAFSFSVSSTSFSFRFFRRTHSCSEMQMTFHPRASNSRRVIMASASGSWGLLLVYFELCSTCRCTSHGNGTPCRVEEVGLTLTAVSPRMTG